MSGGLGEVGVGGAAGAGIGAIIGGIVGSIVPGPGTALGLQLEQLLVEGSELLQVEQEEQELVQGLDLLEYITLKQRKGKKQERISSFCSVMSDIFNC